MLCPSISPRQTGEDDKLFKVIGLSFVMVYDHDKYVNKR